MLNGAISGVVSTIFSLPFQVISTNMKTSNESSMINVIKNIYKLEGFNGFYRGLLPNLIKIPLAHALFFKGVETTTDFCKNKLKLKNELLINSIASTVAISTECLALNPLLLVSTRNEKIGFNKYKNIIDGLITIKKTEGLKGYTKGLKPLLLKELPSKGIFYVLYQYNYKYFKKSNYYFINKYSSSISAIISGILVTVIDNPFDNIRTRAQVKHINKEYDEEDKNINKIYYTLKDIYKKEGIYGIQKGLIPRIYKKLMSGTITIAIYQLLKNKKYNI